MNYLITGNRGFIGTNLTSYLHSLGHSVTGLDYSNCDLCDGFPNILFSSNLDVIVHLAAETNVRDSIRTPVKTFLRNCQSTINLLELARIKGCKLIYISSCGAPYLQNPYAASKIAGEGVCKSYRNSYSTDIVILRLPSVYGPFSAHKQSVVASFITAKVNMSKAKIYDDGSQTRNFVYVEDICRAIHEAAEDLELTTGELTSINNLARLIGVEFEYFDRVQGEVSTMACARNIIPKFSLEEGLALTIKWFEEAYKTR